TTARPRCSPTWVKRSSRSAPREAPTSDTVTMASSRSREDALPRLPCPYLRSSPDGGVAVDRWATRAEGGERRDARGRPHGGAAGDHDPSRVHRHARAPDRGGSLDVQRRRGGGAFEGRAL